MKCLFNAFNIDVNALRTQLQVYVNFAKSGALTEAGFF